MIDKEEFKYIEGFDEVIENIPNFWWGMLHDVLEFRWFQEYDYEEEYNRSYFEIKMASEGGLDIFLLRFEDADFVSGLDIRGWISGFTIENRSKEYQRPAYEVLDFEDGAIHMFCSGFSVKILQLEGKPV